MSDDISEVVLPPPNHSRRPTYRTEITGNYWQDLWETCKIGMPCAWHSLLTGIASGAGVGVIRAIGATPFVASNWAVGTFMDISLGSWCRVARVVEEIPNRVIKSKETSSSDQQS
ncbi:hypothetical protein F5141DRAFT_1106326 [Pisolithus sp. B1]|nr:hypothetical protein F5141DRAFT_1106326 [Pisolithus sp. B1]